MWIFSLINLYTASELGNSVLNFCMAWWTAARFMFEALPTALV
jgi:hypothetical protein